MQWGSTLTRKDLEAFHNSGHVWVCYECYEVCAAHSPEVSQDYSASPLWRTAKHRCANGSEGEMFSLAVDEYLKMYRFKDSYGQAA
jgi:hypothetical protein